MSTLQFIHVVFLVNLVILGTVTVVLLAKGLWKNFPVFSAYCACSCVTGVALYVIPSALTRTHIYWASEPVLMLLELGVTFEIFKNLFAHEDALRKLANSVLYWSIIGFLILGGAALYFQPVVAGARYVPALLVVSEALRTLEVRLILALLLFSRTFALSWRQPVFGVALG